jgi:hypothetical protein
VIVAFEVGVGRRSALKSFLLGEKLFLVVSGRAEAGALLVLECYYIVRAF